MNWSAWSPKSGSSKSEKGLTLAISETWSNCFSFEKLMRESKSLSMENRANHSSSLWRELSESWFPTRVSKDGNLTMKNGIKFKNGIWQNIESYTKMHTRNLLMPLRFRSRMLRGSLGPKFRFIWEDKRKYMLSKWKKRKFICAMSWGRNRKGKLMFILKSVPK